MPAKKKSTKHNSTPPNKANGANLGFEAKLCAAADALRNNMDAAEYKHGCIGPTYISDTSCCYE